jgi:hypothetical protein
MPLPVSLGGKAPGQLIKSDDWNALIAGVNAIEAALDSRVGTLESAVTALDGRLGDVETEVSALRTDVDAILASTYRVTLETPQLNFAIGAIAEITARVRDARGEVPPPVDGERPWVDFVTTWGKLRPSAGFTARAGVAERSISVQTNAEGVARARLSAEIVDDMTEDTELEFAAVLDRVVGPASQTIGDLVLAANTPSDAPLQVAYQAIRSTYDNPQAGAVRHYVDSYYVDRGPQLSGKVVRDFANQRLQRWRDHRITVLAFGKADADPRTPDPARGANAIQLTFRDWIGPWILVDYLPAFELEIPPLVSVLRPTITNDYFESANLMRDVVQERVQNLGLLGKTRTYEAMRGALDAIDDQAEFLPELRGAMKSAVALQQSFQQSQVSTIGGAGDEVAFLAFTNTAVRADSQVAGVDAQLRQVQQQVQDVQTTLGQQVAAVEQSVGALGGRVDATLAQGGQVDQLRNNLTLVSDQVQALRALGDPSAVSERLNIITSLDNRLQRIERGT